MSAEKEYLAKNILINSEVAEILDCSTKSINYYVNNEGLEYLRKTANGLLFLRQDVETFKNNKENNKHNSKKIWFDYSGTTSNSISYYMKHKNILKQLYGVYIFFNDLDAIVNGYYEAIDNSEHQVLKRLKNPHMVIKDTSGNEIWLQGCNCGYRGEGPRGSIEVLKDLGIANSNLENIIRSNDVIKMIKEADNKWEFFYHSGIVQRENMFGRNRVSTDLYLLDNNLVLVQSKKFGWDSDPLEIINAYQDFIPTPKEVIIFNSKQQAEEFGYIIESSLYRNRREIYPVIIKDLTGRQLWLSPHYSKGNISDTKQSLIKIIDILGFELNEELLSPPSRKWLNIKIYKSPPEPIVIKR